MNEPTCKFGNVQFAAIDIENVRRLAAGDTLSYGMPTDRWGVGVDRVLRDSLQTLKNAGFADCYTHISGEFRFVASAKLLQQKEIHDARIFTFRELAEKMGRDVSPRAVKALCRRKRLAHLAFRKYPSTADVQEWAKRMKHADPDFTEQQPIEPGDRVEFSSPALTTWYVQQFLSLNHLKA